MSTYSANAYILLMEDSFKDINYSNFYNDGVYDGTKYFETYANGVSTRVYNLTHGKKYYLQFIYKKLSDYGVTEQYTDTMKVKMNMMADTIHTTEIKSFDGRVPVLNEEVDTVHILKDITLTSSLNVEATKDMILDLNGYTLSTSANDYVIRNNGNLTIIDDGYERQSEHADAQYIEDVNQFNRQTQAYSERLFLEKSEFLENKSSYTTSDYEGDGLLLNLSSKNYGEEANKWVNLTGDDTLDQTIDDTKKNSDTGAYTGALNIAGINNTSYTYEVVLDNVTSGFLRDYYGMWVGYTRSTRRITGKGESKVRSFLEKCFIK